MSNVIFLISWQFLLGQLQCDDALWLSFYTLAPEFEFGVDGSMKHKVLLQAFSVEGADWRVMAHLLRYEPEAQIVSGDQGNSKQQSENIRGQTSTLLVSSGMYLNIKAVITCLIPFT